MLYRMYIQNAMQPSHHTMEEKASKYRTNIVPVWMRNETKRSDRNGSSPLSLPFAGYGPISHLVRVFFLCSIVSLSLSVSVSVSFPTFSDFHQDSGDFVAPATATATTTGTGSGTIRGGRHPCHVNVNLVVRVRMGRGRGRGRGWLESACTA